MKRLTSILLPVAALALSTPLMAQDAAIDTDADGMYSFPELQVAMPDMTEDQFTVLDVNGDGLLDADEIAAGTDAGLLPAMDG